MSQRLKSLRVIAQLDRDKGVEATTLQKAGNEGVAVHVGEAGGCDGPERHELRHVLRDETLVGDFDMNEVVDVRRLEDGFIDEVALSFRPSA